MSKSQETVSFNTYRVIKRDIIFGDLSPGIKLKLNVLKDRYKSSVSILREILNRLASEGFVRFEEQRGFFVAPVSADDLVEVANLRILLETHALELSFKNGDSEWEASLVAAHYRLSRLEEKMLSGDLSGTEEWKNFDRAFHRAVIQACNSNNLLSLHAIIYDKYLRYQMQRLTFRGADARDEHKALLDASLSRDTKRAKAVLRAHVENGLKHALAANFS